jgi:uncharacterized repeat protein (TIGR01451 family)
MKKRLLPLLFFLAFGVITFAQNVTIDIQESSNGCGLSTDCENNVACFDLIITINQPGWELASYNIWTQYPRPATMSYASDNACLTQNGGDTDDNDNGQYRVAGINGVTLLQPGVPTIFHTICYDYLDAEIIRDSVIAVGGRLSVYGFPFNTTVTLSHTITGATAGLTINIQEYLNINSNTLSCLVPDLLIEKELTSYADNDGSGTISFGDLLTYTITTTNTGNITQSNVVVSDPILNPASTTCVTLPVGAQCILSGTYTVSQADVNAGKIVNVATVVSDEVGPYEASITTPIGQHPEMTINKTLLTNVTGVAGQTLIYKIVVTNTGNTTLNNVAVSDLKLTPQLSFCAAVLPGQTCTLTGAYLVTQADIDAGQIVNTANAISDETPPATTELTTPVPQYPSITTVKTLVTDVSGGIAVGDVLTYSVKVTNTGNTTLHNITVSDPMLTPTSKTCATLAPAGICIHTGTYVVQQSDIDAGQIVNTGIGDSDETDPVPSQITTTIEQTPAMTIAKTMDTDISAGVMAGDILTYTVTITNAGNITLNNVVVSDNKITPASATCASVAPNGTCSLTGTYTLTQADIDAGEIGNTGTGDSDETDPVTTTITTPLPQNPMLTVVKTAAQSVYTAIGEEINYTITVTNTGNVTIDNIEITDANADLGSISCSGTSLLPGEFLTCTAIHTIDMDDMLAGEVVNIAQVTGDDPLGNPLPFESNEVIVIVRILIANDDSAEDINGYTGQDDVLNVFDNDLLNGVAVNPAEVTLTETIPDPNGYLTLNSDGSVDVAPGTPAGTYTLTYTICEILNLTNCDNAIVTVEVTAPGIVAEDDSYGPVNGYIGNNNLGNALDNDSYNGIVPASIDDVDITELTPATPINSGPVPVLDITTGIVSVPAQTPAGIYTIEYKICDELNPTLCDLATITIVVAPAEILAVDDTGIPVNGYVGAVSVLNVLDNDELNGDPVILAEITLIQISSTHPGIMLDPLTGNVRVAPGTPAGNYELVYSICEILNPANCDQATAFIPVTAPEILAVDDNGVSINGYVGGVSVPNVLVNDLLNGISVDPLEVLLTQISTTNTGVTLNEATGAVSVAPGTPAGNYELVYQICEILNPANFDQATAFVPVTAPEILAVDDNGISINGYVGGVSVPNVLVNDLLNGLLVNPLEIILTQISSTNPGVTLDPVTGAVTVAPGTPAGNYELVYQICEILNPANCDQATAFVPVTAPEILAVDDNGISINGYVGGVSVPNVLVNDLLNGALVNPLEITLSQISTTNAGVTLDPVTGAVNVAPGTPAGNYELVYQICEILDPANCDQATAFVEVTFSTIVANDDYGTPVNGYVGAVSVLNVLDNDELNGVSVNPLEITLTQISSTHPGVMLDPITGNVRVAPGTPAGNYELVYRICEILNPTNCDQATAFIPVTAAEILAIDDNGVSINGYVGGVSVPNVLVNDLLNGLPVNPLEVLLTQISTTNAGVTLNEATGAVNVAPGTPAGNYELVYQICEILNPSNCDQATAFVPVTAAEILAFDDNGISINGYVGGVAVPNVLLNDLLNGLPVNPLEVVLTQISTTNPGVTLDPVTGAVNVAPGTPAGSYELVYQICEILNPANCDQATAFVAVTVPEILAVDDNGISINGYVGGVSVPNVLVNDLLNGVAVNPLKITLTQISTTNPGVTLNPVTGEVAVAPGAPAGNYELLYQICEILNPANCDQATAFVPVTAPEILAVDDNGILINGVLGGVSVPNVLVNDLLNGIVVNPALITLTQISTTNPDVTLDPITGAVNVAPGTPTGTYYVEYQICEVLNPTNCDQALVTVPVFQEPTVTFCINGDEAQSSGLYAYCSTEPVAFTLCGITTGVAPFDICYEINGVPDCVYDIALDDVIFSQLFATGTYNITIISITDDAGYSVVDLSSYHFDFTISAGATAFAGNDAAICEGSTYELSSATAQNASSIMWSGGDGAFAPSANVLNPVYTPGSLDILAGSVELCLTAQSELPCTLESVDCMTLTITASPSADADSDIIACESDGFVMLDGVVNNAASAEWNTSGTDGFFADQNEVSTIYFFGADDIANGGATLCLTATAIGPCLGEATDCLTLTIIADPTANAGSDATICEGDNYLLSGANVTDAGDIMWETFGDGLFDNPGLLHPVYTPGVADVAAGTVQLCINAEAAQNCGTSANDCMILTIAKIPQANLGGNLSLTCDDYDIPNGTWLPVALTNTITGDYASIQWTTNGDGTFSDPTAVAPMYNPGLADIWKGDIELCVTVQGVEACQTSDTKCMMLYIPQQLIYFDADGWWGISSYLDTDLPKVSQVMDPLVLIPGSQHLVTMLDKQGKYFWPEPIPAQGNLGNWIPIGYKAKIKNPPACLPIYGDSLLNQTFTVSGAFTFLPVLTNVPVAISDLLAGHLGDILLIYDWSNKVLWTPQAADFTELFPGRAYLMVNKLATGSYTIEYPDFVPNAPHLYPVTPPKSAVIHNSPWQQESNTAVPHILLFDDKAMRKLNSGDILAAFDSQGNCYGQTEYGNTEEVFSLIAMGRNDQLRDERAGFETGEKMFMRRYNAATGVQQAVTFVYDNDFPSSDGMFAENGASRVVDFIETATNVNDDLTMSNVTIYPNPASSVLNIKAGSNIRKVELLSSTGQIIMSQSYDATQIRLDVSQYKAGVYIVSITQSSGNIINRRVTIF